MTDVCSDETENSPSLQPHTLREFEQHLNDLKKENFSLKLRIYFLEERILQKYEDTSDNVYRTNIELKVEVESLKQELQEKQDLLDKALSTAESLSSHNEAELQRRCEERQQEIDHMQELLETKIQLLQEEAELARCEAGRMASLARSSSQTLLEDMKDSPEEEESTQTTSHHPPSHTNKDRVVEELTCALRCKEALITELSGQKSVLALKVGELEGQVVDLSSSLLQKERDAEFYQEELGRERLRIEQEMQEACRICARELCGNQRRWIFHPASKLNLQVLLSHALGRELTRDGRGEFACSKCAFILERMYRFDTVVARVEALSIERLQRLLQEKHRLRGLIGGLYRKTNGEEGGGGGGVVTGPGGTGGGVQGEGMVDMSGLTHAKYCALLQEDLVYSLYESWAEEGLEFGGHHHGHRPQCPVSEVTAVGSQRCGTVTPSHRKCQGCTAWRVVDSDYEAVCKVPRKLARSISCGPSTRYSASVIGVERGRGGEEEPEGTHSSLTLVPGSKLQSRASDSDRTLMGRASSSPSIDSLDIAGESTRLSAIQDRAEGLGYPRDPLDDRFSDSLSEEHDLVTPLRSASHLSLALCLVQNCVYRPVQSPKGSRLPVLLRQSPSNGSSRLSFYEPALGLLHRGPNGEGEIHGHVPDVEAPLIRLDSEMDGGLDLAEMEELWEDLYHECPLPRPHQTLIEEQHSQLNQYECAAGQCISELQKAQLQVQSLQTKIQESEANNTKLQEKLSEMECDLRSIRQAAQSQEHTIQGLTDSVSTKDNEAQELYQLIEGQNTTLCKLREMAHHNQITQQAPEGGSEVAGLAQLQGELVGVQSSLFTLGLELEASQRAQRQSQRQAEDLTRAKDRLHSDLKEALQHREVTDKHNKDLLSALAQSRSALQAKEAQQKESEAEKHMEVQERDKNITQLKLSLQVKESQLQEYSELLESVDSSKPRDILMDKLRERIRDRDRALERSIDEKFRCLEEREEQVRSLQLALREKERDLERLRCILLNNQETITSLDALVRGKELDVEQAAEAHRNLQWLQQQSEEREKSTLRERDTLINQLQFALQTRSRETQDLTAALLAKVQAGPSEVVEELKARLALKEKLFQELLSDRNRQSHEHQAQVQDLLSTISTKDQYIQDCSDRLSQVIGERTGQLQELHRQLSSREREMGELRKERERERTGEAEQLQNLLKEKGTFIRSLMQGQEESMEPSTQEGAAEVHAIQEELQLVRKKEREAQLELSALRSALTQAQQQAQKQEDRFKILAPEITVRDQPSSTDHQSVLEQLVNEYHRLNNALRAEKRLYQSLNHIQTRGDSSSEKTQDLLTELDSVQALRGQLEEVLTRTRKTALALEKAAKRQSDFGGGDGQGLADRATGGTVTNSLGYSLSTEEEEEEGDDEEGSTDEFSDSIEDNEEKLTVKSLASTKNSVVACGQGVLSGGPLSGALSKGADGQGQQLAEQKRALEEEVEEMRTQLETTGCSSLAQMRTTLQRLQQENAALKETQGGLEARAVYEAESDDVTGDVGGFWQHMDAGLREQAAHLRSDLALSRQESRELQERLMVSEATVHAQAEQLKDYRELLTETSVEQDSKQVQVDLQDLGYETCGRSENEAEREDASSPEFDDLEMCTSLSHRQDYESAGVWFHGDGSVGGAFDEGEEPGAGSLQQLVLDLRSQLTRCHKVIRGLQLRVRSLSTTSDYASSLERTPRKVNWAFEASPALSGVEDDEGWMSDSLGPRMEPKPSRELRELVSRVASLEAQLKSSKLEGKGGVVEEGKCATWPGKYNTLIQAQARELSHLRQRMREGRDVCHILTQHLGDTTKGFEELLRANDIDYYMGQSFREQLAQSTALAQRMGTKISGRDRAELHDDKMGHELLALRLSKELQQKDKIIESLHTKLQQRPDTPSSSHALSETTDQSDRTSFVSDECRTNEDLELCSDVDAGSEYAQEVKGQGAGHGPGSTDLHPSLPPSSLKSSSSCPNMLYSTPVESASQTGPVSCSLPTSQSLPRLYPRHDLWGQRMTFDPATRTFPMEAVQQQLDTLHRQMTMNESFVVPHAKARSTAPPTSHHQPDHSPYRQITHHAFYPHQLGGRPAGPALKADADLVESGALWDMENMVQPIRVGSSGYYSGNSFTGVDVIKEHLREVQCLRQHLEESIRTNERLRQQLEERLSTTGRDGAAPTNIYIRSLDSVCQLSNEIRVLKEENLALQARLQASSDTCKEAEQLREVAVTGRARLKQAELEAEQWKEELRRLQTHSQEQGQQIHTLRQERQNSHDKNNRLQHEVSLLQQQLCESRELLHSLQSELQVYHRVCSNTKGNPEFLCEGQYGRVPALPLPGELGELLGEVRSLRAQLQSSVQENSVLKQLELHKHLEQKLGGGVHGGLGSIGGMEPPRTPSLSALTDSPQRDSLYRRQLLHDPAPSPPVRDIGLFNCGSPYHVPYTDLVETPLTANDLDPHSELQGDAPDGSFSNRNGRHTIGHVDDYSALQQQVLEGRSLVQRMETALQACLSQSMLVDSQDQVLLDYGCVRTLLSNTKTLRQILEEAVSLLKMFWRAALPSTDRSTHNLKKEQCMQEEILSLRGRISEQEEVLQGTVQRLRSTSRTKESMEHFIVNQLSRTRDVLKKARTNLELKTEVLAMNGLLIGVS
ncbi:myomegalin-like [Salvelinus namaycush]|uniref:Myomegalin-like n=1 Tax=Salvelinus namaycush TaxID=8040 RepID=A0A8U1EU85_SALNM|nr:myomegalin-like [Salvelinus namaycush]